MTARTAATGRPETRGRTALLYLVILVAACAAHLAMATRAYTPVWLGDEIGYLQNTAFIAGQGSIGLETGGYFGGWSLLMVPAFLATETAAEFYSAAVYLSAVVGAATVVPAAATLRLLGCSRLFAGCGALLVATAVPRLVLSNYALAENLLVLLTVSAFACAVSLLRRGAPELPASIGLSVLSVLAFLTHARAVPFVVATALWGAYLVRRGRRGPGWVMIAVSLLGGAAAYAWNSWLVSQVYSAADGAREQSLVQNLLNMQLDGLVVAGIGQLWYHAIAWYGLALLGLLTLVVRAAPEWRRREPGIWTWCVLVVGGSAAISLLPMAALVAEGNPRLDYYLYGRYLDQVAVPVALLGWAALSTGGVGRRLLGLWLGLFTATTLLFLAVVRPAVEETIWFAVINIPALLVFRWPDYTSAAEPPFVDAAVAALVGFTLLCLAVWLGRRGVAVLLVLAAAGGLITGRLAEQMVLDQFDGANRALGHPLGDMMRLSGAETVSFCEVEGDARHAYTFLARPVEVVEASSTCEEPEALEGELVLAGGDPAALASHGAERIASAGRSEELWVMPGPLQARLRSAGFLDLDPSRPMPGEAMSGRVEVLSGGFGPDVDATGTRLVRFRVTHTGAAAPWTAHHVLSDGGVPVDSERYSRIAVSWPGAESCVTLFVPHALVPGQTLEVTASVPGLPGDVADSDVRADMLWGDPDEC